LTEDQRQICSTLGISEDEFQQHRRSSSAQISLNAARGTGTIAAALDSARAFVAEGDKNQGSELEKLALLAQQLNRDLGALLSAASVGSDDQEENASLFVRDERGNSMLALPIRGRR
jgi:hypothetical protein